MQKKMRFPLDGEIALPKITDFYDFGLCQTIMPCVFDISGKEPFPLVDLGLSLVVRLLDLNTALLAVCQLT